MMESTASYLRKIISFNTGNLKYEHNSIGIRLSQIEIWNKRDESPVTTYKEEGPLSWYFLKEAITYHFYMAYR